MRQTKFLEEKQKMTKTTPKKNVVNGDAKETLLKKTVPEIILDGPTLQSIPDLRLEAKITAQVCWNFICLFDILWLSCFCFLLSFLFFLSSLICILLFQHRSIL